MNSAVADTEPRHSTELGDLPESWQVNPLGNALVRTQYGLSIRGEKSGRYPILRMNCQQNGRVVLRDLQFVDIDERTFAAYRLDPGDLLFNRTNSFELVGRSALFEAPVTAVFASYLLRLVTDQSKLLSTFLNYYLASETAQRTLKSFATRGVSQSNISASKLQLLPVPRPPIPEQRAIAGVLSKLQAAIELQDRIVATLKELKAAAMAKLFREGLRGEPLKQTEIGEMPESWEVVNVGDLGAVVTGTTPSTSSPEYYIGDIPFIGPADISDFRLIRRTEKTVSESGLQVSRALPPRAVLVVCIGSTIGKVGMTTASRSCTNQQINAIVPGEAYAPEFVHYLMVCNAARVRGLSTPSPVPILSKSVFAELGVAIPSDSKEREKIGQILAAVDDALELVASRRASIESIFQSVLGALMSGRIRVSGLKSED